MRTSKEGARKTGSTPLFSVGSQRLVESNFCAYRITPMGKYLSLTENKRARYHEFARPPLRQRATR